MRASQPVINVLMLIVAVVLLGTAGYHALSGGKASLLESAYMTIITISTVGYGEVVEIKSALGRSFTILLILIGMGIVLYGYSSITAFIVEGGLHNVLWRRRVMKKIAKLRDHVIVCGAGRTGRIIIEELVKTRRPLSVVEKNEETARALEEQYECPVLPGDAHDDATLLEAGIEQASGLVTCLPSDNDNLFVIVSASLLKPGLRIVAKGLDPKSRDKFLKAGASSVVLPTAIGGLRMVSEMVRPSVVTFLDHMLRGTDATMRVEEVDLSGGSTLVGRVLRDSGIRENTGAFVLAMRPPGQDDFVYNPSPDAELLAGMTLIVIGNVEQVQRLRGIAAG